jgi:flagellar basal-body rod protein FlgB
MIRAANGRGPSGKAEAAMDLTSSGLFTLAERRLAWIDRSQEIRAENIANADTPGYQPAQMPPFSASLDQAASLAPTAIGPMALDAGDIPLPPLPDQLSVTEDDAAKTPSTPDGNAVGVENQLGKLADSETMQDLVINIYGAYLGMFRTALDISGTTG